MNSPADSLPSPVRTEEIREVLTSYDAFAGLSDEAYAALAEVATRVSVPAGEDVYRPGETMSAFIVERGRVRLLMPLSRGEISAEVGRGRLIGLTPVLADLPLEGRAVALRDTRLIRLEGSKLLSCLKEQPELIIAHARYAQDMALRTHGEISERSRPQAFALLPVDDASSLRDVSDEIVRGFAEIGIPGQVVDFERVGEIVGAEVASPEAFERAREPLAVWCDEQEAGGHFLLFECDATDTPWTRWCLGQTDRVAVAAQADDEHEIERIDAHLHGRELAGRPIRVDLILVQDRNLSLPSGTGAWLRLACRRRHHHVRPGNPADFQRLARRMSERPVGVVLGGGGARGLAHIGVLQALEEADVPIDAVGGTSMGSVIAAAYARGLSPAEILELIGRVLGNARAVMDLDFPMVAILAGRKLDRVLHDVFGETDISDLWLPFFCISSSLTEGRMVTHDRGSLWQCLRASCSLPGIFPPVNRNGQLLVDGALVNNVPLDVMRSEAAGSTVIAADVGGGGPRDLGPGEYPKASGWNLLLERLKPGAQRRRMANILQVLAWSTLVGSKQYLQQLVERGDVDLLLTPPVTDFELLGFDDCEKLYRTGYEHARKQIAAWDGLSRATRGSGPSLK